MLSMSVLAAFKSAEFQPSITDIRFYHSAMHLAKNLSEIYKSYTCCEVIH